MNLSETYVRSSYISFLKEFLPDFSQDIRDVGFNSDNFIEVKSLGASSALELTVLEVELNGTIGKRVAITNDAFRVLKNVGEYRALVVFNSKDTGEWRLSLMAAKPTIEDGKVITKLSNPRRYSYLLGRGAKTVTPYRFLIKQGKVADFEDLQKRFSVEVVNNEFYKEIAKLYDNLVGTAETKPELRYPLGGDASHQFAVRLMGRIVFCWFLREKHSSNGIPLIDKSILSLEAAQAVAKGNSYYHSVLAPLFFEVLNKLRDKRTGHFAQSDFGLVPYLNGGLFSPQNDDYYRFDSKIEMSVPGLVAVSNEWIIKLFELLETYHFTVDENTSVDIELSIDPEMLGRIFENLLARINPETGETVRKSTGSFYTPREIVEFMVDESLVQYLLSKAGYAEEKLRALISYDLDDDNEYPLDDSEIQEVVRALHEVKILDPACGSGAFPIGILQKIVYMLQQIDPEAKLWFESQISVTSPEVRHLIEREFRHKNFDYIRKLGIIRESIFGVDIQPIATEIARLRCFLTLIVDERVNDDEVNRGVEPLPNLDFKFVTANTLIKLSLPKAPIQEQMGLYEDESGIDELKRLRDDYFDSHNSERDALKLRFLQSQKQMFQNMIANHSHGFTDITQKLAAWDPFSHETTDWFDPGWMFGIEDGFDIVIGNPPYVQLQKNSGELADLYKDLGFKTFIRTGDIYTLFYESGLQLTKATGFLCFITSNKWMRAAYGKLLRKYLFANTLPIKVVDFSGFNVFESATVDTAIVILKQGQIITSFDAVSCSDKSYLSGTLLSSYVEENKVRLAQDDLDATGEKSWFIGNSDKQAIKRKIENIGVQLRSWDARIYYGIKTGRNEVFIIDKKTKEQLVLEDSKSAEVIRPMLRGCDIKRYKSKFADQYVLFIPWHFPLQLDNSIAGVSHKAEQAFIETYPAVYSYLSQHKNELSRRNKAETGIRYEWYALQRWGADYYEEFEREKISWGNLALSAQFALVEPGFYINAPSPFLVGENLHYLLGVLNSSVGDYYIRLLGVTRNGGYFEYKPMFVDKLPVPKICDDNRELVFKIESLVKQIVEIKQADSNADTRELEASINELVYEIYDITPKEIAIIETS